MNTTLATIYTIGHSNHAWGHFAELLAKHEIRLLIDVRSYPRSRFAPWSKRDQLESRLSSIGLEYLWAGKALGGIPRGPRRVTVSQTTPVDRWYRQRVQEPEFIAGIIEISRIAKGKRSALMCSEGDATRCHRSTLLTPQFIREGFEVLHIDPKGAGASIQMLMHENNPEQSATIAH